MSDWRSQPIVFMGTPEFAAVPLRRLLAAGAHVAGVVCQPDKPAGRGRQLNMPPVKAVAIEHGIEVQQPAKVRGNAGFLDWLEAKQARVAVVAAYGKILPQPVLDAPALGCLNIHASLLPRWRGAAPIQRAIAAGDARTGVSLMQLVLAMDAGPVFAEAALDIGPATTGGELHDALAGLGAELLIDTLPAILSGTLRARPQDPSLVTFAPMLKKEEGLLDWSQPAGVLHNLIRAFNPWPGAFTTHHGDTIKIHRSRPGTAAADVAPGTIVATGDSVDVATGAGVLSLLELQAPGRKKLAAADFLRGYPLAPREVLGGG